VGGAAERELPVGAGGGCSGIGQKPFTLETIGVAEFMKMFVNMPKDGKL
jgi:hypothetical protein